jgi:hypothetical protein
MFIAADTGGLFKRSRTIEIFDWNWTNISDTLHEGLSRFLLTSPADLGLHMISHEKGEERSRPTHA